MADVIFYGPLGKANAKVVGGGESGNLKTISILEKSGIEIIKLRKPYPFKSAAGKIKHILYLGFMPLILFVKLFSNREVQIVHIAGFYKQLIYQELLLIYVVRLFGKKCIYELRAGGLKEAYDTRSSLYRFIFQKAVTSSNVILVQGERYVKLLKELGGNNVVHYPNYIMGHVATRKIHILNNNDCIQIVYFGRMSAAKNVLFMIDVGLELKKRKISFELELIGEGDVEYVNRIKEKIKESKLSDVIKISQPAFGLNLIEKLKNKHFFLFPTQEPREGHSNSLTEAMSLGVVPICSDYGFNREIVNSNKLILNEFNAKSYCNLIVQICEKNLWSKYSNEVQETVASKFTSSIVQSKLLSVYKQYLNF